MKILLTAFEPFGGEGTNASLEAMKRINAPPGMTLIRLEVPTVFGLAGERVLRAVREEKPDAVVCLGQAAGRSAVTPERVAINLRDASIPDNAGNMPKEEPVVPGGPAAYFSTLPIRAMVTRAQAAGVPAAISNSAGTFVCNDLMYALLHALSNDFPEIIGGFIHVPACTPLEKDPSVPLLSTEKAVDAIQAMLAVIEEESSCR